MAALELWAYILDLAWFVFNLHELIENKLPILELMCVLWDGSFLFPSPDRFLLGPLVPTLPT